MTSLPPTGHAAVALIAGGTKGIGKATATALAQRGMHVVVVGRTRSAGETLVAELRAAGHAADFLAADLSLMAEVRHLAAAVEGNYKRLDLLIHSADILRISRLTTAEGIEASFAVNYSRALSAQPSATRYAAIKRPSAHHPRRGGGFARQA